MRNNQDRLGVGAPTDNLQPAHEPVPTTDAMQFIVPTEVVDLPSKGLFYEEGHPLHNRETVEIKHMTTKEEDILTNQSFIKNGSAIDRLLQSVLVEPRMNIQDMLVGDKNALTVACRIYGYGPDYETQFNCPSCGVTQQHSFDLSEVEHNDFMNNLEEFDAEIDYERNTVILPIPRTKTRLELKILKDDIKNTKQKGKKANKFSITNQYQKMIYSVNGNSDRQYVKSYISSMSALDSRYLRAAYNKIIPGVDFSCSFECDSCGHDDAVEVPLKAEFFWPKS
tara:strand:+ start:4091 stop:4933 length:843 start_codon:yes stop_codon:yes gene_type:complete